MSYARIINSIEIYDPIKLRRPFSNYKFCEKDLNYSSLPLELSFPIKRIFSQIRVHKASTMLIEKIPISGELNKENNDLRIRTSENFLD